MNPNNEATVHRRAEPSSETPLYAPVCGRKRALDQAPNHAPAERMLEAVHRDPAPQTLALPHEAQGNTCAGGPGGRSRGAVQEPLSDRIAEAVLQHERENAQPANTRIIARKLGTGDKLLNPKDSPDPCSLSPPAARHAADQGHVQARAAADRSQRKGKPGGEWKKTKRGGTLVTHLQGKTAGAAGESSIGKSSPAGMPQHPKVATPGFHTPSLRRIPAPGLLASHGDLRAAPGASHGLASIAVPQSGVPTGYPSSTVPDQAKRGVGRNLDPGRRRMQLQLHPPGSLQKPLGDVLQQAPTARDQHRSPVSDKDSSKLDNTSSGLEASTGAAVVSGHRGPTGGVSRDERAARDAGGGGHLAIAPELDEAATMREERQARQLQVPITAGGRARNVHGDRRTPFQELTSAINGGDRTASLALSLAGRGTGGSTSRFGRQFEEGRGQPRKPPGGLAKRSGLSRRSSGDAALPCVKSVSDECSPGPLRLLPSSAVPAQDGLPCFEHGSRREREPGPSGPAAATCSPRSPPPLQDLQAGPWSQDAANAAETQGTCDELGDSLCKAAIIPARVNPMPIPANSFPIRDRHARQEQPLSEKIQECHISGSSQKTVGVAPGRGPDSNPRPLERHYTGAVEPDHLHCGPVGRPTCMHGEQVQGQPSAGAGQGTSNSGTFSDPTRKVMAATLENACQNASSSDLSRRLHQSVSGTGEATCDNSVEMVPDTLLPLSEALLLECGDTREEQKPDHAPGAPTIAASAEPACRGSPVSGPAGCMVGSHTAPDNVLLPNQALSHEPSEAVHRANSPGHPVVCGETQAEGAGAASPSDPDVAVPDTPISPSGKQTLPRTEPRAMVSKGPSPSYGIHAFPPTLHNPPRAVGCDPYTVERQRGGPVHTFMGTTGTAEGSPSSLSIGRPRSEAASQEQIPEGSPDGPLVTEPQGLAAEPSIGEDTSVEEACSGGNRQGGMGSPRGGWDRLEASLSGRGGCGDGGSGPDEAATQGTGWQGDDTLPEVGTYLDVVPSTPADAADGMQGVVEASQRAPDSAFWPAPNGRARSPGDPSLHASQGGSADLAISEGRGRSPTEKVSLASASDARPSDGSRAAEVQTASWGAGSGSGEDVVCKQRSSAIADAFADARSVVSTGVTNGADKAHNAGSGSAEDVVCKQSSPAPADASADTRSVASPEPAKRADIPPNFPLDGAPDHPAGDRNCSGGADESDPAAGGFLLEEAQPAGTPSRDHDMASAGDSHSLPSGASGILSSHPRRCHVHVPAPGSPGHHQHRDLATLGATARSFPCNPPVVGGARLGAEDVQPGTMGPKEGVLLHLQCVPPWVPPAQSFEPEAARQEAGMLPCSAGLPPREAGQLGQSRETTEGGGAGAGKGMQTAMQTGEGVLRNEDGVSTAIQGALPSVGEQGRGPCAVFPPAHDQEALGNLRQNAIFLDVDGNQGTDSGTGVFGPLHAGNGDKAACLPCLAEEAAEATTLEFSSPVSALTLSSSGRFVHSALLTSTSGFGSFLQYLAFGRKMGAGRGAGGVGLRPRKSGPGGPGQHKYHVSKGSCLYKHLEVWSARPAAGLRHTVVRAGEKN